MHPIFLVLFAVYSSKDKSPTVAQSIHIWEKPFGGLVRSPCKKLQIVHVDECYKTIPILGHISGTM